MFTLLAFYSNWSLLIVRIVLGVIFVAHGWPKLKNLKATSAGFSKMGFKPGVFWGPLVALVEFFGGLALIAGFYVQPVALIFIGEFFVINLWKIFKRQPLVGGWEFDLLILAVAISLLTLGGGGF
ncbi:MAG: DoxX family protein [Patescibacteria group bacterium]|nr:DoxX family protein [Patescibacteria group bacterium]MDE2014910.1 DoxX family protein [Patescibacteria group bacterium]MDE2226339.1 DoxX family protein [Patescibacteria group bacterium]